MGLYDIDPTMSKYSLGYEFASEFYNNFGPIIFKNDLVVVSSQVSNGDECCTKFRD